MTAPVAIHCPAIQPVILDRLLVAIAQVESGDRPNLIGKNGERSRWQITREVWKEETGLPFDRAKFDAYAYPVARAHLIALKWRLNESHVPITVKNLALAWNGGATAAILGKMANAKARDYAERVERLYLSSLTSM